MQRASYKRSKLRCLPGDVPKRYKIAMLEKDVPIRVLPWQIISCNAAKSYRKDHRKHTNRRWRYSAAEQIQKEMNDA